MSTFKRGLAKTAAERTLVRRIHAAMTTAGDRGLLLWKDDRDETMYWLGPGVLYERCPTRDWLLVFARALLDGGK